jgi:hypothetical protein
MMSPYDLEELVLSDEDLVVGDDGSPCRLRAEAEEKVRELRIRRLVLKTGRVVDLSGVDIVLIPETDSPTEIVASCRIIASRLHANRIKLGALLVEGPGLISTDPEGWLVVTGDLICDKLFGSDVVVGGVLSADVLTAENIAAGRLYVGTLFDGVKSLLIQKQKYFDGEVWGWGAYAGHAIEPAFNGAGAAALVRLKKLLNDERIGDLAEIATLLDHHRPCDTSELTIVGMERIKTLRWKLQLELRGMFGVIE